MVDLVQQNTLQFIIQLSVGISCVVLLYKAHLFWVDVEDTDIKVSFLMLIISVIIETLLFHQNLICFLWLYRQVFLRVNDKVGIEKAIV